jgi:hypothetical protein
MEIRSGLGGPCYGAHDRSERGFLLSARPEPVNERLLVLSRHPVYTEDCFPDFVCSTAGNPFCARAIQNGVPLSLAEFLLGCHSLSPSGLFINARANHSEAIVGK